MNWDVTRNWLIRNTDLEPALLEGAAFDQLIENRLKHSGVSDEAAYMPPCPSLDLTDSGTYGALSGPIPAARCAVPL